MFSPPAKDIARMMSRVVVPDDHAACWMWTGSTNGKYGRVQFAGRQDYVHRVALSLRLGRPLRDGEYACHSCDEPLCCNPLHLWAGSHEDNMHDASRKGRMSKSLTAQEAREIYALRGTATLEAIGKAYGIRHSSVWKIQNGHAWQQVTGAERG